MDNLKPMPDPVRDLIAFAEGQSRRQDKTETCPDGQDWNDLYSEVLALKTARPLELPARGVRRLTDSELSTLINAMGSGRDKYREYAIELRAMTGVGKPVLSRLAEQFDQQAVDADTLVLLLAGAGAVEVIGCECATRGAMEFSQQPIIFPQWLRALGFEDQSYSNDCAGRAMLPLVNGLSLCCWVNFTDKQEREGGPDQKLYHLHTCETDGDMDYLDILYDGDDAAECQAAIDAYLTNAEPCADCGARIVSAHSATCFLAHPPEPSHDDSVKCCPDCEKPNQFGELCAECTRDRDAREATVDREL